jgi:WhiB family redox-sensing transcriptional regulator
MIRHPILLTFVPGLVRPGEETAWQDLAACTETDPDSFFPELGEPTGPAKRICRGCEVTAQCLQYALDNHERFGVWGGLSERERRRLAGDPETSYLCTKKLHLMEGDNVRTDPKGARRCQACKAATPSRKTPATQPRKAAA